MQTTQHTQTDTPDTQIQIAFHCHSCKASIIIIRFIHIGQSGFSKGVIMFIVTINHKECLYECWLEMMIVVSDTIVRVQKSKKNKQNKQAIFYKP